MAPSISRDEPHSLISAAHADAWKYAGVLHRDISVSNILLKYDAERDCVIGSMLCDWDISKFVEELGCAATQPDRAVSLFYNSS